MNSNDPGVYKTLYRSGNLPGGRFREVNALHVHVDGGGRYDWVLGLVRGLEAQGSPGKLNAVSKAISGPQRAQQPETYQSHTPGGQQEDLEYFSTTLLANRAAAIGVLRYILPALVAHPGGVVEVERVVASFEKDRQLLADFDDVLPIQGTEVGFETNFTLDFEVHHGIDLDMQSAPVTLAEILRETHSRGIVVGGWFQFEKQPGICSYRSNSFWKADGLIEHVQTERQALTDYLRTTTSPWRFWTIIERVLAIWQSPLNPIPTPSDRK